MPNDPTNTPPADPTPTPAPQNTPPPADPKPQETPPAPTADPKPTETKPTETPPQNTPPADPAPDILDLAKGEEQKKQEADEKAKADFDAYVKAAGYADGLKDEVLKKGENGEPDVTMPAAEVGAVLDALKRTGIAADKAKPMIGMIAALDQFRAAAQAKEDERVLAAIREETRKEFGDNLGAAARDMVSGGMALFGADLWRDICTIPALVNDKRFVRSLASYGRSGRNDSGGPAPASGGASGHIAFDLASFARGTNP